MSIFPPRNSDYLHDLDLSPAAKGLFSMLMMGPLHLTNMPDMSRQSKIKLGTIKRLVKELESRGYLLRKAGMHPRQGLCGCACWQYRASPLAEWKGFNH